MQLRLKLITKRLVNKKEKQPFWQDSLGVVVQRATTASYKCDEWHDSRQDMKGGEKSKTL